MRTGGALVCVLFGSVALASPAAAGRSGEHGGLPHREGPARADRYRTAPGTALSVPGGGVLRNDRGGLSAVVAHGRTAHGTVQVQPDGSFTYRPEPGFAGTDRFTYTATDAVRLFRTGLAPLAIVDGVPVTAGAFGSSIARVPGRPGLLYGLTDRGPNVDHPSGVKVEPLPEYTPRIGRFRLVGGRAVLERQIPLRDADGVGFNGGLNCGAVTGETVTDLQGRTLPCSARGYDTEGLVALPDGSFWVSDEYGPFLLHLDRTGRLIERLSPFEGSLPRELSHRTPNQGMEGLTLTPDGRTLVGVMQSALSQPDLTVRSASVPIVRIVTVDLPTRALREYLYLLDDPQRNLNGVSEITAMSNTEFLVVERGRTLPPESAALRSAAPFKRVFRIDLNGATDVGPRAKVPAARYDALSGGLLVPPDRRSLEARVGAADPATATAALADVRIAPVSKKLVVDLQELIETLDLTGGFFGHDKIEGIVTPDRGKTLVIANDSDFGIVGSPDGTWPFRLLPKVLPDGRQDDGEFLVVRLDRLPARTSTATVMIDVS
ncbi:MAG: hypothetical protein QG608_2415 [Actinomycetota bacterium]|nr:hypothetical protein [Actinomycetota bacterium]